MPWNVRIRGHSIPMTAVVGGIGTFAAWISVIALHVEARTVGVGWMIFGLGGYALYRRSQGLDLTSQHRIARRERPPFFVELDYRSAIVPIFGTDVDASALRTAAKLVGEEASVEAVYVLRVPNQLSLDAGLEEEEQLGLSVLESAKLAGRKAGLKIQTRLIRTRNPGLALVEEARRRQAEIIYLGTAHAPPAERALGPTANYLLAHRPCRVVIEFPQADEQGSNGNGNGNRAVSGDLRKESVRRGRNAQHAAQTSPASHRQPAADHQQGV
jgi:APA family basic amino acid/polyamine antiporter